MWAVRTGRSEEEDAALVAGLRRGDEEAYRALVARFGDPLYRVVVGIVGETDAEEVVADVFLQVFRKIHTFRGDAAFSSWIYRIALNAARMRLRSRRRRNANLPEADLLRNPDAAIPIEPDGHMAHIPDWSTLPESRLLAREVAERIERAVEALPAAYRIPFHLVEILGWDRAEVCRTLGITPQTLKSRLHRARLSLRTELADLLDAEGAPARPRRPS